MMDPQAPIWESRGMDRVEWLVLRALGDGDEAQVETIRERLRVAGDNDSPRIERCLTELVRKKLILKMPGDTYVINKEVFLRAYRLLVIACQRASLLTLVDPEQFFLEVAKLSVRISEEARELPWALDTESEKGIIELAVSYWVSLKTGEA